MTARWGVYGATGFTGRMIVAEAVERGHRPVLLGRSEDALREMAAPSGLDFAVVADPAALASEIATLDLVVNAAGPFEVTAAPVLDACVAGATSYLDISNELATVQLVLDRHEAFASVGATAVPAVGFGTVATEAAAARAISAMPGAISIEVALLADNAGGGAGTAASVFGVLAQGAVRLVSGRVTRSRLGRGIVTVRTPLGRRSMVPIATGDLATIRASSGVETVAASVAFAVPAGLLALGLPIVSVIARTGLLPPRPARTARPRDYSSHTWARATDASGRTATAWLSTGEGYAFTASSVVSAVGLLEHRSRPGAFSSGQAFGADFALRVPGTTVEVLD